MSTQEISTEDYYEEIFEKYLVLGEKTQKEGINKFEVVSKLVSDLWKHKNSKDWYQTISNLIITSLTSMDDSPVDIFSHFDGQDSSRKDLQEVIVEEFRQDIKEYEQLFTKGKKFLEILERFSRQYDQAENIELGPIEEKKKLLNWPGRFELRLILNLSLKLIF